MPKSSSNNRLYRSDGETFICWKNDAEIEQMLSAGEIKICIDRSTGREMGWRLIQREGSKSPLPSGRSYNPLLEPPSIRYEIPHAGDCRTICMRRYSLRQFVKGDHKGLIGRRIIKVSARKIDLTRPPYRTTPSGLTLPLSQASSALNSPTC